MDKKILDILRKDLWRVNNAIEIATLAQYSSISPRTSCDLVDIIAELHLTSTYINNIFVANNQDTVLNLVEDILYHINHSKNRALVAQTSSYSKEVKYHLAEIVEKLDSISNSLTPIISSLTNDIQQNNL